MYERKEPSPEEKRTLALTHLSYRTWCSHYVAEAKQRTTAVAPLRSVSSADRADCCFHGSESQDGTVVHVARKRDTQRTWAVQVQEKGTQTSFPQRPRDAARHKRPLEVRWRKESCSSRLLQIRRQVGCWRR